MVAANQLVAERDKKAREQMKKKKRLKQEARDWGEDVSSDDDDDDDDDDDEVVVDVDWGILEDKDTLTSDRPSMQGPFPFHVEGSESVRSVEARESTASHGVSAKDRWMGEGGPAAADPEVMVEGSGSSAAPHETVEGSGSGAAPHETVEGSDSSAAPHEVREMSPLPQSRGQAQNGPAQTSRGRDLGIRPQNASAGQGRQRKLLIPLFSSIFSFLF